VTRRRGFLGLHPSIWMIASTHLVVDAYNNIFAPLLPLLIPRLGLSLTAAGTLAMCFQLANSVAQLGFGALADRWRPRVLVMAGPLLSVLCLSLIGIATTSFELGAILVLGGLGGAAFHPPASALVYRLADHRKGLAMSAHISGGSLGFSLSPLLFAPFVAGYGLEWSPLLIVPGLAALSWTLRRVPAMERPPAHERAGFAALRPAALPLTLLYFTVVLRTVTSYGFMTFVPTLLTRQGMPIGETSTAVSLYLLACGIGGFLGGPMADRFGSRAVVLWSLVLAVPFLALAPQLKGWWLTAAISAGGFILQSTLPVSVTFGQAIAKVGAATVASLMMGFAWGMGSLSVPLVGGVADRAGIETALTLIAFVPLVAAGLAAALPDIRLHETAPAVSSEPTP
jgi:FSR family fosmidomycin resistance protein-like MFS transporter